ncbi:hypothetical protein DIPPA_22850 [Diplonema papillatum]|nr:hypothetical protein DIPPA_22850 [Diplonema papillatum]
MKWLGLVALAAACQAQNLSCDAPWVFNSDDYGDEMKFALNDLRRDWNSILGCPPALVITGAGGVPSQVSTRNTGKVSSIIFGKSMNSSSVLSPYAGKPGFNESCATGKESHCVLMVDDVSFGGTALLVVGSDTRGLLFAIYAFSEVVFGRGATDHWLSIDYVPTRLIEMKTVMLPAVYTMPSFEWRAVFFNDEELFGGLHNDPMERSVWSADIWNKMYETCLRMKVNMVLPGTNVFPDDDSYKFAAKRGLAVTTHHYNLLFMSPCTQDTETWFPEAYDYQKRPDAMMFGWEASVKGTLDYPDLFYPVGLRGAGDEGAPCDGPCTTADKGSHVQWAITNQTEMVRKHNPDAQFMSWLWDEGLQYLEMGVLKVPENTTLIFADGGDSNVKGLNYATHGAGIYTHVAMFSPWANQLTEMVPPSRIFGSMQNFRAKKVTKFFILNVSDLMPYIMTTSAYFMSAWDGSLYSCNASIANECDVQQTQYMTDYAMKTYQLSQSDAQQTAAAFNMYFNVPYLNKGNADTELSTLLVNAAAGIATGNTGDPGTFNWTASAKTMCQAYESALEVFEKVPATRKQAFTTNVLNSLGYHCLTTSGLVLAQAAVHTAKSNPTMAASLLQQAVTEVNGALDIQIAAEGIKFRGLYGYDGLSCYRRARRELLAAYDDLTRNTAPQNSTSWALAHDTFVCTNYKPMYEYQYQFYGKKYPLQSSTDLSLNMYLWPQAYCEYVTRGPGAWCEPTPHGGNFGGTATITLKTTNNVYPVVYIQNGGNQMTCNPSCSVNITETTTFSVFAPTSGYPSWTNATFTKVA